MDKIDRFDRETWLSHTYTQASAKAAAKDRDEAERELWTACELSTDPKVRGAYERARYARKLYALLSEPVKKKED